MGLPNPVWTLLLGVLMPVLTESPGRLSLMLGMSVEVLLLVIVWSTRSLSVSLAWSVWLVCLLLPWFKVLLFA